MKKLPVPLIALVFIVTSCQQDIPENIKPEAVKIDTIRTFVKDLEFKLTPLSSDEFFFTTRNAFDANTELLLITSKDTLIFKTEPNANFHNGNDFNVKHNFKKEIAYRIVIRNKKIEDKTILLQDYILEEGYHHRYVDKIIYEKIASAQHIIAFDITPSRNFIYFIDYVNNVPILNRLALSEKKNDVIESNFQIDLRAAGDDDIIVFDKNFNGRFLGSDSCAILNYNVKTKSKKFIAWGSDDYGRFSRVIDNTIFVTNPISNGKSTLIDLSDGKTKSYQVNSVHTNEYSFDHIYNGNSIFNVKSQEFQTPLPFLNSQSGISYFDEKTGNYLVSEGFYDNRVNVNYSRLLIYKDQHVVFELPFMKGTISVPKLLDLSNNKFIIHQQFDFSNKIQFDGFYLVDIKKGTAALLKNDTNFNSNFNFFLTDKENSFYSVRPNYDDAAIYKMSLIE